jgi:hypothetical protein
VREELRARYDGYHFMENSTPMYNPFSVLSALKKGKFDSYWFETGTPTYLVTLLQRHDYNLENLEAIEIKPSQLINIDSHSSDPFPFFYQSGYMTITGYNEQDKRYQLGFPNKEVEDGFRKGLLPRYARKMVTE